MKYRVTNLTLTLAGNSVAATGVLERSSDGSSWQQELTINTSVPASSDPAVFENSLVEAVMAIVNQDLSSVNNYLANLVAKYNGKVFTV